MFCKFLKEKYQKLAKYYNEIRTSPNAYIEFRNYKASSVKHLFKNRLHAGLKNPDILPSLFHTNDSNYVAETLFLCSIIIPFL